MQLPKSVLTKQQSKDFRVDLFDANDKPFVIVATVRHDDECGNGHNSFAITGTKYETNGSARDGSVSHATGHLCYCTTGGCIHEEIAEHFPNLRPLLKWHLTSTDGPLHYVANTLFLAGDRDCWGCRKGEPRSYTTKVKHGHFPVLFNYKNAFVKWLEATPRKTVEDCEVITIPHDDPKTFGCKFTLGGFPTAKWHECPFDTEDEALNFIQAVKEFGLSFVRTPTQWGEGKERQLDAARHAAVWPDATDEQLMQEPEVLKAALIARLPALMKEFKVGVESLGFVY